MHSPDQGGPVDEAFNPFDYICDLIESLGRSCQIRDLQSMLRSKELSLSEDDVRTALRIMQEAGLVQMRQ